MRFSNIISKNDLDLCHNINLLEKTIKLSISLISIENLDIHLGLPIRNSIVSLIN